MTIAVAMLRGVNVGGKNILPMAELRAMCEGIGLGDVSTYIQSGNVVFRAGKRGLAGAAGRLEEVIEAEKGFRPRVVVRTAEELRRAAEANPFAVAGAQAKHILVMFLAEKPVTGAAARLAGVMKGRERARLGGREVYLHFPEGVGGSRLSMATVEKAVGVPGTCRNVNTIQQLLSMAEALGGAIA